MQDSPISNEPLSTTSHEPQSQETAPEQIPSVENLETERSEPEKAGSARAEHLRQLALAVFNGTRMLHELGESSQQILERSAQLNDLRVPHTRKKPLRAIRRAIQDFLPEDPDPKELDLLAPAIAFQHGMLKRKDVRKLDLSPAQQRELLTISAVLRIAEGLDASDSQQTNIQRIQTARDGVWIVVDGPQAISDAAAAQQQARLWEKIGYPPVKVWETAEAASKLYPYPEPTSIIGINPKDALSEAARKVMTYHFAQMLSLEAGTRKGEDIEDLHHMRVATRRLRAAFEVFGDAFEPGALKQHLKGLRATGRALGAVRDLDVFMEKARQYTKTLPEDESDSLEPLFNEWQKQREKARAEMITFLDSQEYHTFKRKYNNFLHTPGAGARKIPEGNPTPQRVKELAPVLIYSRLANVQAFGPYIEEAPVELLHALRIEFKKLRYTVEYFKEVLGSKAEEVIEELKTIQDHLGDLNDAQVATQILREFIDGQEANQEALPASEDQNLQGVVKYMATKHSERLELMITFRQTWKHFSRPAFRRFMAQAISVL